MGSRAGQVADVEGTWSERVTELERALRDTESKVRREGCCPPPRSSRG